MAQFDLSPDALNAKYGCMLEDVAAEREIMAKRLATLEAANREAHAHRYKVHEQKEKIQEVQRESVVVIQQQAAPQATEAQTAQADVDNLLEAIERKDKELAEQDARIETLLAFVPERDVAMVFDGTQKGPRVHDLGDGDLDEVAAGTRSPRQCDRPVVVCRFPQRQPVPAELSELDIRRHASGTPDAPEGPPAASGAPHQPRKDRPRKVVSSAPAPRADSDEDALPSAKAAAEEAKAGPAPPKYKDKWSTAVRNVDAQRRKAKDAEHAAARERDAKALKEARAEIQRLMDESRRKDEQLYAAARDVVDAKREALDAKVRLARGETELAAAHRRMGDEAVAMRGKYEGEAQKARAALDGEVRGATVAIREERDMATRKLRHAETLLDAQGGRHAGALKKARASVVDLKKKLAALQKRRKQELEGYGRDVAELRARMERVKLAQKAAQARDENSDPRKIRAQRKAHDAKVAAKAYQFAGRPAMI